MINDTNSKDVTCEKGEKIMKTIREEARDIQVFDSVDVVVAGAGLAGFSAALNAARSGAKTLLVERNGCLGGVATASYMANIGNVMITRDNTPVVGGTAAELIDRLVAEGAASRYWCDDDVPGCVLDAERLKVVLIAMLKENNVRILTHCMAVLPLLNDGAVRGIIVENKEGRQAVLAGATIDATGEADLAHRAGAETRFSGGKASTLFQLGNVNLDEFVRFVLEDPEGFPSRRDRLQGPEVFQRNWNERGILFFPHGGGLHWRWLQEEGGLKNMVGDAFNLRYLGLYALKGKNTVAVNSNFYQIENLEAETLSRFELHSQEMCFYVADFLSKKVPGFIGSHIVSMGTDLGIRTSRRIVGRETLSSEHLRTPEKSYRREDAVGMVPTLDNHNDWRGPSSRGATTCDIPYGILLPRGVENLLVASGKSVSTEPIGELRSMVQCMVCGQAAGVAAAISVRQGLKPGDLPIDMLRTALVDQNVKLLNG